jgi:hypothetical protein
MGKVNREDIRGYQLDGGDLVCTECATDEDTQDLKEDEILAEGQVEGDVHNFCDRCKWQL